MVIYKYMLRQGPGEQTVPMHRDLEVVHAGLDASSEYCIWARVDTESPIVDKKLRIVGTGERYSSDDWTYVATFAAMPFMWHVLVDGDFYQGRELAR